jgi:hypothetical protein
MAIQPPNTDLKYEKMEKLMPKCMGVVRPDIFLVIGTVNDYMKIEHKVREKQLARRGCDPLPWLVYEEDYGSHPQGARW